MNNQNMADLKAQAAHVVTQLETNLRMCEDVTSAMAANKNI